MRPMPTRDQQPASRTSLDPWKVDDLVFDALNPRLPEGTVATKAKLAEVQAGILEYFRVKGNLDELARSYADNGYFQTEPLIVTSEGAPPGKRVVLEGNRRLAALRIVLEGTSADHDRLDVKVTPALRKRLATVPVLEVAQRADATAMIGFRHIGGLKFWDSEAKARWIKHQVDAAGKADDPFGHVARMVGMSRASIRYYYLAASLVNVARDEEKYEAGQLAAQDRFGVFLRAVENPNVREYVGLSDVSSYAEAKHAISGSRKKSKRLVEVLNDIAEPNAQGKYVVGDSRNIPRYGDLLANEEALKTLRRDGFDAALAFLAPVALEDEVHRVLRQLQRLRGKLDSEERLSDAIIADVTDIQRVAKFLRSSN